MSMMLIMLNKIMMRPIDHDKYQNGDGDDLGSMYICIDQTVTKNISNISKNKAILRRTMAIVIIHLLFICKYILLLFHFSHVHGQTLPPTAAIVRRLYYPPNNVNTATNNPHNPNPYRSMIYHHNVRSSSNVSPPSSPTVITRIITSPKGVAKVTPISIQSFDSKIKVLNLPSIYNQNNSILLQKPSTSLIQVLDSTSNLNRNSSTNSTDNSTIQTLTTTTTTTIQPSRKSKSLLIINQELNQTTTTTTTTITTTTESTILTNQTLLLTNNSINDNNNNQNNENLCFLLHGGSSETFTVNEAVPVNSVIGTIKVIGDATNDGNIELSIINNDNNDDQSLIPIKIEPGTKELILIRKLDKESVEGESSVNIGVRCRPKLQMDKKLQQNDHQNPKRMEKRIANSDDWIYDSADSISNEDIIIPIRILVTDANDNKPEWQGNVPYTVNISEMTTPGSIVMTGIKAVDNDQLGPYSTVEYYVEPGPYSHLLRFASPLEGTLILTGQLDYETLSTFWISIRAQDQGNPPNTAVTKVNVQVIDADDQNPRFEVDKYTAILAENQITANPLQVKPKPIRAEDPDRAIRSPIVYEFNSKDKDSRENSYFKIDAQTGQVSLKRPLHSSISLPITLVIRATQLDNRDRYALTTLTLVSKRDQMMPELRFLHTNYSISLLESTPPGQVALTVQTTTTTTTSASNQPLLKFQILDDEENYFSIKNNTSEIIVNKMLDYEKHHRYSFRVLVTDGIQTDLSRVTIDIINVNEHDPIFAQSTYVFHVNEARLRASSIIGQIQATDADDGDRIQLSLSGPHASAFALSMDGKLRLRNLRLVNTTECHMIAIATDSGHPPRSSSASVVVKFSSSLLKSLRTSSSALESLFLFDFEQQQQQQNDHSTNGGVDILQHSTNSTALVLVIVLGVLLGTLFIIIVALTLHVLKNRKYESRRSSSSNCSPITALHHSHHHHNISSMSESSSSSSASSSDLSFSAMHHQHLPHQQQHWSTTNKDEPLLFQTIQRTNKVAPLDAKNEIQEKKSLDNDNNVVEIQKSSMTAALTLPIPTTSSSSISSSSNISSSNWSHEPKLNGQHDDTLNMDNIPVDSNAAAATVASRISVIRWPQGSIPRRVKKLTWKDEQRNNHLDQLYTGNSVLQATTTAIKTPTKTLSGHLLTRNSCQQPNSATVNDGIGHYHLQQQNISINNLNNSNSAIRHHQTPHYPLCNSITEFNLTPHNNNNNNKNHNNDDPSALPDLTVYF